MIVGVCGKAGSGKDTIADILVKDHGFVKVAFSDPLKRICRDVFDWSYDSLWGPSEKRNEPDARYPQPFTAKEEEQAAIALKKDVDSVHREYPVTRFLTPRFALQQLGTEWGRNCYPDIWVEYALRIADKLLKEYEIGEAVWQYDAERGLYRGNGYIPYAPHMGVGQKLPGGVVISDVRFLNEVDALRKRPDVGIWKVNRASAGLKGSAAQHQSELEVDRIDPEKFTYTIDNNGSLDDLVAKVNEGLQWKGAY